MTALSFDTRIWRRAVKTDQRLMTSRFTVLPSRRWRCRSAPNHQPRVADLHFCARRLLEPCCRGDVPECLQRAPVSGTDELLSDRHERAAFLRSEAERFRRPDRI